MLVEWEFAVHPKTTLMYLKDNSILACISYLEAIDWLACAYDLFR